MNHEEIVLSMAAARFGRDLNDIIAKDDRKLDARSVMDAARLSTEMAEMAAAIHEDCSRQARHRSDEEIEKPSDAVIDKAGERGVERAEDPVWVERLARRALMQAGEESFARLCEAAEIAAVLAGRASSA